MGCFWRRILKVPLFPGAVSGGTEGETVLLILHACGLAGLLERGELLHNPRDPLFFSVGKFADHALPTSRYGYRLPPGRSDHIALAFFLPRQVTGGEWGSCAGA